MKKKAAARKLPGLPADLQYRIQVDSLSKAQRNYKLENERLREELGLAHREIDAILDLSQHVNRKVPVIAASKRKASESVAVAVASDWHCEETVEARKVNGKNEYNLGVAAKRIEAFFSRVVHLTDLQRNGTDIDTLLLPILGDIITGYIHDELVESNGASPVDALLWVAPRLANGIRYLRDKGGFKRLIIPCCVGNHGRTTAKRRIKTRVENSYEWMLYHMLARELADPKIEWHICPGYHQFVEVYDLTLRCHHGDAIRYAGGVGGITIPVNKAISQWDKTIRADLDLFGHYHQTLWGRKFVSNGSLIGYNEFAVEIKGDYEPPQQAWFLLRAGRGRTLHGPIFVD